MLSLSIFVEGKLEMFSPFLVLNRWEKQGAKDWEYYTLESLLYFVNNKSEPHPGYCQKAAFQGVKAVRRPDRKALLNYFKGDEGQFRFTHGLGLDSWISAESYLSFST